MASCALVTVTCNGCEHFLVPSSVIAHSHGRCDPCVQVVRGTLQCIGTLSTRIPHASKQENVCSSSTWVLVKNCEGRARGYSNDQRQYLSDPRRHRSGAGGLQRGRITR